MVLLQPISSARSRHALWRILSTFVQELFDWLDCVGTQIKNEFAYGISSHHWTFFAKGLEDRLTVGMEPIEADKNFYVREKTRLFEKVSNVDAALYKFFFFSTEAAKTSSVFRRALVDVGALSLVIVAFVASDPPPSNLVDIYGSKGTHNGMKSAHTTTNGRYHTPSQIPLDMILTEAKTLSHPEKAGVTSVSICDGISAHCS